jgi:cation diffusion facilitator CzcD-associated flavoprotein CzcO
VNLREEPIEAITASGITTNKRSFDADLIVFATGFRKPPPDRAAEKGSVAVHGHCEATLTWAPRRSSTARRPRACAKNGSPVHDREKSDPRGLLLVHVHPRAVSGACPEALRKQAGAAARLEE